MLQTPFAYLVHVKDLKFVREGGGGWATNGGRLATNSIQKHVKKGGASFGQENHIFHTFKCTPISDSISSQIFAIYFHKKFSFSYLIYISLLAEAYLAI